jgi:hypothetical protein
MEALPSCSERTHHQVELRVQKGIGFEQPDSVTIGGTRDPRRKPVLIEFAAMTMARLPRGHLDQERQEACPICGGPTFIAPVGDAPGG